MFKTRDRVRIVEPPGTLIPDKYLGRRAILLRQVGADTWIVYTEDTGRCLLLTENMEREDSDVQGGR